MMHCMRFMMAGLVWASVGVLWAAADEPVVHPALNNEKADSPVGKRPYEMDWANRTEPSHPQLVDFEDLTGWQVRCFDGAEARLARSKQELLFGQFTGHAVYAGKTAVSRFILEPPAPIAIPTPFTGVDLWVRGNNWGWVNPPATARVGISILVRDAKEQDYAIPVGAVDFDYWFLLHATCVSPDGQQRHYEARGEGNDGVIDFPARFTGIEVTGCASQEPAQLYFDALSFYEIEYPPLQFKPIPETLPWPTTPDTILPSVSAELKTTTVNGDGAAAPWSATISDGAESIVYTFDPAGGTLDGVTAEFRGQRFQPCRLGGIVFEIDGKPVRPGDAGVEVTCVGTEANKTTLFGVEKDLSETFRFEMKASGKTLRYLYTFQAKGKSLIVDAACEVDEAGNGPAASFNIGLAKGLETPKTVFVPFLTYGNDWPRVVCSSKAEKPLFLLAVLDYFNSDASELFGAPRVQEEGAVAYTGGSLYKPTTAGKRNPLRERLFINVSGDVQEVLPNIPTKPCDTGEIAREHVWRNIGSVFQNDMLSKYKAYGIDAFIACHHEVGWREAGESFTLRDRPAPSIGDEALAEYGAFVRGLGYRFGTYTNYVDFAPVNANWNEDDVCLDSDGRWQRAWPRCYALKPLRAAEKEAEYAPRINERYGTSAQYCDVHTAYTPWGRTDYDARTPGAGMFRTQYNAFARLLLNESIAHKGPVFSEGNYHWFYAGIVDGNYATIVPYGQGWKIPPVVDFDLLKLHPKMTDFGMGMPLMYFGEKGAWTDSASRLSPWFDRFHTATIAFGHIGFLADNWGFDGTMKSYYLIQALQRRYAMVPVKRIGYFNGKEIVDTSTALITDAYKRGQVFAEYENGLQTYCNLSFEHDWPVSVAGRDYTVPPAGFVAYREGDILAYSAAVDGRRHEYVECADYLYIDTRDQVERTPAVTTRGAVAVKPDGEDGWWVIPAVNCEEVTISLAWLGGAGKGQASTAKPEKASDTLAGRVSGLAEKVVEIPGRIAEIPGRLIGLGETSAEGSARFAATAVALSGEELGPAMVRPGDDNVTLMPWTSEQVAKTAGGKAPIKYHLKAASVGTATIGAWRFDLPSRDILQSTTVPLTVSVEIPAAMDSSSLALTFVRETPTPTESVLGHATLSPSDADGKIVTATVDLQVPQTVPYSRCWYRFSLMGAGGQAGEPRWLDIIAVPPFDVEFASARKIVQSNKPFTLTARVRGHFPEPVEANATLRSSTLSAVPLEKTVQCAPGKIESVKWPLSIPNTPFVDGFVFETRYGEHVTKKAAYLNGMPSEWEVARLAELPLKRGQCLRGHDEAPYDHEGTAALIDVSDDKLAGKRLKSIFMHPPYKGGVGYCFAGAGVDLPEGNPRLDFSLGFREGSSTQDGCVFSVLVLEDDKKTEIFKEQYATLGAWAERSVDLSPYAGKTVTLKLITDVGPADNSSSDWALWGAPRIVMGNVMQIEILDERPLEEFAPPPAPLAGLKPEDLKNIASACLKLETAGVNTGPFASYVHFNGIEIGETPRSDSDTAWEAGQLELPAAALATIGRMNTVVIRNPNRDYMKVRAVFLEFALADGRAGTSMVALGPYSSDTNWEFKEGVTVPLGNDLAAIQLIVPMQ